MAKLTAEFSGVITIVIVISLMFYVEHIYNQKKIKENTFLNTTLLEALFAIAYVAITFYEVINWPHDFFNSLNFILAIVVAIETTTFNKHLNLTYKQKKVTK